MLECIYVVQGVLCSLDVICIYSLFAEDSFLQEDQGNAQMVQFPVYDANINGENDIVVKWKVKDVQSRSQSHSLLVTVDHMPVFKCEVPRGGRILLIYMLEVLMTMINLFGVLQLGFEERYLSPASHATYMCGERDSQMNQQTLQVLSL